MEVKCLCMVRYIPHDDAQSNCGLIHLAGFFGLAGASGEEGTATTVFDCLIFFEVAAVGDAAVCVACD